MLNENDLDAKLGEIKGLLIKKLARALPRKVVDEVISVSLDDFPANRQIFPLTVSAISGARITIRVDAMIDTKPYTAFLHCSILQFERDWRNIVQEFYWEFVNIDNAVPGAPAPEVE